VGNRDLIRVAVARRPEQAIPIGVIATTNLAMEVEVNVKTESTTDANQSSTTTWMQRRACVPAGLRDGLEGIVSKRMTAPYRSGRSADWIKVKNPDSPAVRHREGRW
jgi:hypothetical protein